MASSSGDVLTFGDMRTVLPGARHEVNGLRAMTDTIAETQMFRLQEEIRGNSSDMLQQLKINERQSTSLDVMQVIFAGSLAFEERRQLRGIHDGSPAEAARGEHPLLPVLHPRPELRRIAAVLAESLHVHGDDRDVLELLVAFTSEASKIVTGSSTSKRRGHSV